MKVRTAELGASPGRSEDRVFVGASAVVVLDGTSGSDAAVSVARYVDTLGHHVLEQLESRPHATLPSVLTAALTSTVNTLQVRRGNSPSSTVAIARAGTQTVDLLVLGDSPIYIATPAGTEVLRDTRLARLPSKSRAAALARLATGAGHDSTHHELVTAMQRERAPMRNVEQGFWIAEAVPAAGARALTRGYLRSNVLWCALLTDGADEPLSYLGTPIHDLAELDEMRLAAVLASLHAWEADHDPHGYRLPRFKRHDDKTIAIMDLR
jgi:hypothetical protein